MARVRSAAPPGPDQSAGGQHHLDPIVLRLFEGVVNDIDGRDVDECARCERIEHRLESGRGSAGQRNREHGAQGDPDRQMKLVGKDRLLIRTTVAIDVFVDQDLVIRRRPRQVVEVVSNILETLRAHRASEACCKFRARTPVSG